MQSLNSIDNLSGVGEVHQSLLAWFLHSKAMTITATTSAVTYLTAYSTDIGQAAATVPQVINFIGTHGPTAGFSWADVMAVGSFLLVITNLIIGIQKLAPSVIKAILAIKKLVVSASKLFKKPRKKVKRNV